MDAKTHILISGLITAALLCIALAGMAHAVPQPVAPVMSAPAVQPVAPASVAPSAPEVDYEQIEKEMEAESDEMARHPQFPVMRPWKEEGLV